jgi:hypothetical protein
LTADGKFSSVWPQMRLSFFQRVKLRLGGCVYVGDRMREGWRGPIPFYAFRCPRHGVVEDYEHGFSRYLCCPKCLEEEKKNG